MPFAADEQIVWQQEKSFLNVDKNPKGLGKSFGPLS